jgi:hypothetical protein
MYGSGFETAVRELAVCARRVANEEYRPRELSKTIAQHLHALRTGGGLTPADEERRDRLVGTCLAWQAIFAVTPSGDRRRIVVRLAVEIADDAAWFSDGIH